MQTRLLACALVCTTAISSLADGAPHADPDPTRFTASMQVFARQDALMVSPGRTVVFVGSSTIRLWELDRSFAGLDVLNRGFGAAHLSDVVHHLEATVLRHRPHVVVLFCGGNDIWSGKPPARLRDDFLRMRAALFAALPRTRLIVLALKPSPQRVDWLAPIAEANRLLAAVAASDDHILFLPAAHDVLLDRDGAPRSEFYAPDGLHLNAAGYAAWTELLRPHLLHALDETMEEPERGEGDLHD